METKINIKQNSPYTLQIPENPSTGYEVVITYINPKIKILSNKYVQTSKMVGGGGLRILNLYFGNNVNPNEILNLITEYKRPWEHNKHNNNKHIYQFKVVGHKHRKNYMSLFDFFSKNK